MHIFTYDVFADMVLIHVWSKVVIHYGLKKTNSLPGLNTLNVSCRLKKEVEFSSSNLISLRPDFV